MPPIPLPVNHSAGLRPAVRDGPYRLRVNIDPPLGYKTIAPAPDLLLLLLLLPPASLCLLA